MSFEFQDGILSNGLPWHIGIMNGIMGGRFVGNVGTGHFAKLPYMDPHQFKALFGYADSLRLVRLCWLGAGCMLGGRVMLAI